MSAKTKADTRPEVNDPRARDNNDLGDAEAAWTLWRARQAKRRGEIAAKKPAKKH